MNLNDITPIILTYNEERNIGDTLSRLRWADTVLIVDSFSTDQTIQILESTPNVTFVQHKFSSHAVQWNYALSLCETPWALTLDADYKVSDTFVTELQLLDSTPSVIYSASLQFCIYSKPLSCSILPPRPVLFQPDSAIYYDDGHTQRLDYSSPLVLLNTPLLHDDKKPFVRWLRNQLRYAQLEAVKLHTCSFQTDSATGKLRRIPFLLSILMPAHILFLKKGILEFWHGWYYAGQRSLVEVLISIYYLKGFIRSEKQKQNQKTI